MFRRADQISRSQVNGKNASQKPSPLAQDEVPSDVEMDDADEKDPAEEELEKLVFGDDAGFLERLRRHDSVAFDLDAESDQEPEPFDSAQSREEAEVGAQESRDENFADLEDEDLFFVDTGPKGMNGNTTSIRDTSREDESSSDEGAAWEDSDDDRIMISLASNPRLRKLRRDEAEDVVSGREYIKRLRKQFELLYPVPDWALPPKEGSRKRRWRGSDGAEVSSDRADSEELNTDDEELSVKPLAKLLRSAEPFITNRASTDGKKRKLRPEVLDLQRTRDVSTLQPSAIESLSFHPHFPLLLSSGPASTIYLHHVAPTLVPPNPLVTSLHIKHTPIKTAAFQPPAGDRIFFSSRRRYFHTWDLPLGNIQKTTRIYGHDGSQRTMEHFKLSPCGRWMGLISSERKGAGAVNILSADTCQWVAQVRIDGRGGLADFAWWRDGSGLTLVGKGGEVGEWSIHERRMLARWTDDGALGTTVLGLGGKGGEDSLGGDRWVAIGSSSGIVNIYDRRLWSQGEVPKLPKPTRVLDQLTTAISHLVFSADGQLLAMGSRWKRDALRLVHLPSCTVYRNWPTSATPLGRITAVAFSPRSDMLSVANEQGKIRLWEIRS